MSEAFIRGGTEQVINRVKVSYTAWNSYLGFHKDCEFRMYHLAMALRGLVAKKMSDSSPYWIAVYGDLRYVFVVRRRNGIPTSFHYGDFLLTNVEEKH